MNNTEFVEIVHGVYAAHNKPLPKDPATLAKWFERLREIPGVAARDIARKLEDCPKLEANLSAQFLDEWRAWRAANPDRCAHEVTYKSGCTMCDRGWVYLVYPERWTVHVAPCGHCTPFVADSMTRGAAEARGFIYVPAEYDEMGKSLGQRAAAYRYATGNIHEARGIVMLDGQLQFREALNRRRAA